MTLACIWISLCLAEQGSSQTGGSPDPQHGGGSGCPAPHPARGQAAHQHHPARGHHHTGGTRPPCWDQATALWAVTSA